MKFVSCIRVASSEEVDGKQDVVLCQCEIRKELLPLSAEEVNQLCIDEILISEGNEIHKKSQVTMKNMWVFTDANSDKSITQYMWYELIKHLTGHKLQLESMNNKVNFTNWVCHAPEGGKWQIIMELESEGIIRKIAQVELETVDTGEVDLFQLTNTLFKAHCQSNNELFNTEAKIVELRSRIKESEDERKTLDTILEERDQKTRIIVVELLNEKKRKISELQEELKKRHSCQTSGQIPDSEAINKHVNAAVSELISPGKRRKVKYQELDETNIKNTKRQIFKKAKLESSGDFDDFQFFGITKPAKHDENPSNNVPRGKVKRESQEQPFPDAETDSHKTDTMPDSKSTIDSDGSCKNGGSQEEAEGETEAETEAETETETEVETEGEAETD